MTDTHAQANKSGRVAVTTVVVAVANAAIAVGSKGVDVRSACLLGQRVGSSEGEEGKGDDLGELHFGSGCVGV